MQDFRGSAPQGHIFSKLTHLQQKNPSSSDRYVTSVFYKIKGHLENHNRGSLGNGDLQWGRHWVATFLHLGWLPTELSSHFLARQQPETYFTWM
jgi:hypothetical protein